RAASRSTVRASISEKSSSTSEYSIRQSSARSARSFSSRSLIGRSIILLSAPLRRSIIANLWTCPCILLRKSGGHPLLSSDEPEERLFPLLPLHRLVRRHSWREPGEEIVAVLRHLPCFRGSANAADVAPLASGGNDLDFSVIPGRHRGRRPAEASG